MNTDLYHVSPESNLASINERGIDPTFSQGKLTTMYYVDEKRLFWAMLHVSRRHHVSLDQLRVFTVPVRRENMVKTALAGVYRSNFTLYPFCSEPAYNFITADPFELATNAFAT